MLPRRYTIYVVFEIAKIFLVTMVVFTGLIVLLGVVQKLVTERVSLLAILRILPYILPVSMQFTLPSSLLFAVCNVYGRLSADNEVMALKAAGVPPMRIMAPTLVLGFLFSPFAVWMMDLAAFWGEPGIQRVIIGQIEQVAYNTLKTTGSYSSSNGFSISVQSVDGHKLIEPEIDIQVGEGERSTIIARVGELKLVPERDVLRVDLEDAIVSFGTSAEGRFHHLSHDISLDMAARKGRTTDRPANIAMHDLANETNRQRESIEKINELAATQVLMGLSIGRYDWLGSPDIHDANARRHAGQERLARLETEHYRRWACGLSCFCFVWLGIPLSIWYRTADYWFVFGVAFLPLLLIYYPLFMMSLEQAKDGNWPPYSVWLGNLGILAAGCWFKHKVNYS
jgi:lipopolysaccharide export system permease protein